MHNNSRLHGALGLSRRAGKCIAGDFAVEKAVKRGEARLVALDASAAEATKARYRGLCERNSLPCLVIEGMGDAIGKPGGKIAAIVDEHFAGMVLRACKSDSD